MAFTRFGGQFQFEKSNGGQVRQFWGRGIGDLYSIKIEFWFLTQLFFFLHCRNKRFVFLFCHAKSSTARALGKSVQDVEAPALPHVGLQLGLGPLLAHRGGRQSLEEVFLQPVKAL